MRIRLRIEPFKWERIRIQLLRWMWIRIQVKRLQSFFKGNQFLFRSTVKYTIFTLIRLPKIPGYRYPVPVLFMPNYSSFDFDFSNILALFTPLDPDPGANRMRIRFQIRNIVWNALKALKWYRYSATPFFFSDCVTLKPTSEVDFVIFYYRYRYMFLKIFRNISQ
jgi:hypothetical protein